MKLFIDFWRDHTVKWTGRQALRIDDAVCTYSTNAIVKNLRSPICLTAVPNDLTYNTGYYTHSECTSSLTPLARMQSHWTFQKSAFRSESVRLYMGTHSPP